MPFFETVVRTKSGQEETKQLWARDVYEAKRLFEQLYGVLRYVPYLPRMILN